MVDSYTISYTAINVPCMVTTNKFRLSGMIKGIDGSMRSYTLTNLEEYMEYSTTIEAINGVGRTSSTMLNNRTMVAGMFNNNTINFKPLLLFEFE